MHRFLIEQKQVVKNNIENKDIVFQLTKVLRIKPNEKFECFDNVNKYQCEFINGKIEIISKSLIQKNNNVEINLIQGMPKAKNIDIILQKATEIGVSNIYLIETKRSISKIDESVRGNKAERFDSIIKEAVEQSHQYNVPKVHFIKKINEINFTNDSIKLVAFENENKTTFAKELKNIKEVKQVNVFIGPEGGFENSEILDLEKQGFKSVTFGKNILRTETSSLYALSVINFLLNN